MDNMIGRDWGRTDEAKFTGLAWSRLGDSLADIGSKRCGRNSLQFKIFD
jgi:hypothetical protein